MSSPSHRSPPKNPTRPRVPKAGPEPLLLSRKEVDVLYEVFDVVRRALELLGVDYIVTGGSLLGAIRQHSILFCDDDIDIAVIDHSFNCSEIQEEEAIGSSSPSVYESIVVPGLQSALDAVVADEANDCTNQCVFQIKPWEGGDRIRSKRYNSVFLDLFVLRKYPTLQSFVSVIGVKRNGRPQPESYVNSLLDTIQNCTTTNTELETTITTLDSDGSDNSHLRQKKDRNYESMFPFWQFATRKAIEMWPKEVYRVAASIPHYSNNAAAASTINAAANELFPLRNDLKFGPLTGVCGPNMPVTLLKRAFGDDCFEVYYRSVSHHQASQASVPPPPNETKQPHQPAHQPNGDTENSNENNDNGKVSLPPLVAPGGTWEDSPKVPLEDEHYLPLQPLARKRRRPTLHCKDSLFEYLETQSAREAIEQEALWGCSPGESNADADANTNTNTSADDQKQRPNKTIYMDGVFDLFHIGHLEAIRQCAALGNRVILGVTGDDDATGYKRKPVVPQNERVAIVSALGEVDAVVCPCPLVVTEDFLEAQGIDLVVHGFASDADAERQHEFFATPMALGKFQRIGYYKGLSTTDRIRTIREREGERERKESESNGTDETGDSDRDQEISDEKKQEESAPVALPSFAAEESETDGAGVDTAVAKSAPESKPQWFGAAVAAATNNAPCVPTDPFPLSLRTAIEPHIDKARRRRREALAAIRAASGEGVYDSVMNTFLRQQRHLRTKRTLDDPSHYAADLVASLLVSAGLSPDTDLSRLHEAPLVDGRSAKDRLLHALTQNPSPFQKAYDAYVRNVCVPRMVGAMTLETTGSEKRCDEIYYQVFPCLRIIQPDEFSIGPHADVAYGHHPCSVNCYVALTDPGGIDDTGNAIGGSALSSSSLSPSSSLFLEGRPGAEDWHALFSSEEGVEGPGAYTPRLELFSGAVNLHWTTENKTARTRVSLDFRLVDGRVFHALECGGHLEGGQQDVYRATPGYYHRCIRNQEFHGDNPAWIRDENCGGGTGKNGELAPPDFRIGFPWTVKNWEKFWKKNTKSG